MNSNSLSDKLLLKIKLRVFKETQDPLRAVEAYLLACRSNLSMPKPISQWIEDGFQRWHESEGLLSLDEIFGLNTKRGGTPLFKGAYLVERNEMLFLDMAKLISLGFSEAKAATAAVHRLSESDWNHTAWEMADIETEYLMDKFEEWKTSNAGKEIPALIKGKITLDYIRDLPKHLIPEELREGLKSPISNP